MIHVFQVHKESIDTVPAAKVGRDSFDLEIFGMVGVPQDLIQEKQVKIYGEPQAKKQKIDHHNMGIRLPGVGGQQLFNPGMGMPVLMQQPVGAPMHMRPMPGGFNPMQMPRGMMPLQQQHMMQRPGNHHMMNFNQQMQPPMRGMQPPRPMGLPNRPPPPHGHPGMGGHPGHQQHHQPQPPHQMNLNPNMQPPAGMMQPLPQQQLQQGLSQTLRHLCFSMYGYEPTAHATPAATIRSREGRGGCPPIRDGDPSICPEESSKKEDSTHL